MRLTRLLFWSILPDYNKIIFFFFWYFLIFCLILLLYFYRWLQDWMCWCRTRRARRPKIEPNCEMLQGTDGSLEATASWLEHGCKMLKPFFTHLKLVNFHNRKNLHLLKHEDLMKCRFILLFVYANFAVIVFNVISK